MEGSFWRGRRGGGWVVESYVVKAEVIIFFIIRITSLGASD